MTHQSETANLSNRVADLGVLLQVAQHAEQLGTPLLDVGENVLLLHNLGASDTSGAGDGVSGVSSTHGSGLLEVHQVLARDDTREGEAVGDTLGNDHDVGADLGVVLDGAV